MPPTLRTATYNLYLGADITVVFGVAGREDLARLARVVREEVVATNFAARAAAIARILVRERVDLAGLQEVARWSRVVSDGEGEQRTEVWLDFLEALGGALAAEGEAYDACACTAAFRGSAEIEDEGETSLLAHNVVLVRRGSGLRVVGERVGDFTRTLDISTGMPELVLNVARSWGWVDVELEGRPLRFVNTHLEAWDERVRVAQRDELLAVLRGAQDPVVIVGDFNATPGTVGMPPEYVDAWAVAGDGSGFTSGRAADLRGATALSSRIDYVWVRGAEVASCRLVGERQDDRTSSGLWPSDHAGVVADLLL